MLPTPARTGHPREFCNDACRKNFNRQRRGMIVVPPQGLFAAALTEATNLSPLPTWRDYAEQVGGNPGPIWRMPTRIGEIGTPCYCRDDDRTCWLHVALRLFPTGIVPPVKVPHLTDQDLPAPPEHFPPEWLPEHRARWLDGDILDPDPLTASAVGAELLFSAGAQPPLAMRVYPVGRAEELEIELEVTDAKARQIPVTVTPKPVEWFAKQFHAHCCRCGGKEPCSSNDWWILRSTLPGIERDTHGHPLHWSILLQRRGEQEQVQILWGHRAANTQWRFLGGRDFDGTRLHVWQLRKRGILPGWNRGILPS